MPSGITENITLTCVQYLFLSKFFGFFFLSFFDNFQEFNYVSVLCDDAWIIIHTILDTWIIIYTILKLLVHNKTVKRGEGDGVH